MAAENDKENEIVVVGNNTTFVNVPHKCHAKYN
jgi:hypothetical protein